MPLSSNAALRKDTNTAPAKMQHRHYATIAGILNGMRGMGIAHGISVGQHEEMCKYFAGELRNTNPNFNTDRFLRACGVED